MGTDEVGALTALKAHRGERVDPAIALYRQHKSRAARSGRIYVKAAPSYVHLRGLAARLAYGTPPTQRPAP
jgi:hypothetical protein